MLAIHSPRPIRPTTAATVPTIPGLPKGFSMGLMVSSSLPGVTTPVTISWSTHGSTGMVTDQNSPETANSQPIGLAGRRRVGTSPTVA